MKGIFINGVISAVLATVASIIYFHIYQTTLDTHFNKIINIGSITGATFFWCMLITMGYALLFKFKKQNLNPWLNVLIAILSFASIISPISMTLPLDLESPELFPGLVVPMHFFPALAFFCISPFFIRQQTAE